MTPEPPYGADLPRALHWSGDYADALDALDAANAEVLALREVVEAVRALALSAPDTAEMSGLPGSFTPVRDAVEDFAIQVCDLLPTPTGDDG